MNAIKYVSCISFSRIMSLEGSFCWSILRYYFSVSFIPNSSPFPDVPFQWTPLSLEIVCSIIRSNRLFSGYTGRKIKWSLISYLYSLTGEDYGFMSSRTTDRNAETCFTFKHGGNISLRAACTTESTMVASTTQPALCDNVAVNIPSFRSSYGTTTDVCREVTVVIPSSAGETKIFVGSK